MGESLETTFLAYNTSAHSTTGYTTFFLMFGRQVQMPIYLMYGKSPSDVTTSTSEYASSLRKWLKETYSHVRTRMSQKLDRQKDIYDEKVQGVPFKQNDVVWLHSTVVPWRCKRKIYRSCNGPFKVVKQLADSVYRLQNVRLWRHRPVVHFNRLKPCPDDIHMPSPVPIQRQTTRSNFLFPPGTNQSQVLQDDFQPPTLPHYAQWSRHPPTHLHPIW